MFDQFLLLEPIYKVLKLIHEKLPDRLSLGFTLLLIGGISLAALQMFHPPEDWRLGAVVLTFIGYLVGGACSLLGSYILFRRGIWMWQDRRAPRINTIRWK